MKTESKRDIEIILVFMSLYILNRFWLKQTVQIPLVSYILKCHFNDWIGGICITAYINIVLAYSKYSKYRIQTVGFVMLCGLVCGILWEYIFPLFYQRGVSDLGDVVAYVLGGLTYFILSKRITKSYQGYSCLPPHRGRHYCCAETRKEGDLFRSHPLENP